MTVTNEPFLAKQAAIEKTRSLLNGDAPAADRALVQDQIAKIADLIQVRVPLNTEPGSPVEWYVLHWSRRHREFIKGVFQTCRGNRFKEYSLSDPEILDVARLYELDQYIARTFIESAEAQFRRGIPG